MSDHVESGSSKSGHSLVYQKPKYEENVVLNDNNRGDSIPQQSRPNFFTVHEDSSEITYVPEDALKEGLGMIKTIKQTLTKLELSSKLRAEVWDREITKFVHQYFFFEFENILMSLHLVSLEGQGSPRTLIAVCGGNFFFGSCTEKKENLHFTQQLGRGNHLY
jgi:hypothetical protein